MKESLYELTAQYEALMDCLYDEDYDEETLLDTIEGIEGEIEEKADGYARIIREIERDIANLKEEEGRLNARWRALDGRLGWLKARLLESMKRTGKTKFKTTLFSFGVQKNGGKRPLIIEDPGAVPEPYLIPQPPAINTEMVRKRLESGVGLTWARLGPQGELERFDGELVYVYLPDTDEAENKALESDIYHLRPTSHLKVGNNGQMYRGYQLLKGSSAYDTKEMSRLIDGIVSECGQAGIETLPPDELKRIIEAYGEKHSPRR